MSTLPLIIYCDVTDKPKYEKLKSSNSYFKKVTNTELFIFAASIGVRNCLRKKIANRDSYTRSEYLKDDDLAIIKTLAVSIDSLVILKDYNKVIEVIEEYAHGGIIKISELLDDNKSGSFEKRFEFEVFDLNQSTLTDR